MLLRRILLRRSFAQGYLLREKTYQDQSYTPTYWGASSSKPQSLGNWEDKVGAALRRSTVIHRSSTALQQLIVCSHFISGRRYGTPPHHLFPYHSLPLAGLWQGRHSAGNR